MSEVLLYPHPLLRQPCTPFHFNPTNLQVAHTLLSMVGPDHGRGLAAPQIGHTLTLFATHIQPAPARIYINPKITHFSTETITLPEGCRSFPPDHQLDIERPVRVTIEATDLNGNPFTQSLDSWEARIIQHEYDHLSGILHIDRVPRLVTIWGLAPNCDKSGGGGLCKDLDNNQRQ